MSHVKSDEPSEESFFFPYQQPEDHFYPHCSNDTKVRSRSMKHDYHSMLRVPHGTNIRSFLLCISNKSSPPTDIPSSASNVSPSMRLPIRHPNIEFKSDLHDLQDGQTPTSAEKNRKISFLASELRRSWHTGPNYIDELSSIPFEDPNPPSPIAPWVMERMMKSSTICHNSLRYADVLNCYQNKRKARPWSTMEAPPSGCLLVNDDYMFPDSLTPTKLPSCYYFNSEVYDVPYIDDSALPRIEGEWPLAYYSRRTIRNKNNVHNLAEEEFSSLSSVELKEKTKKKSKNPLKKEKKTKSKS